MIMLKEFQRRELLSALDTQVLLRYDLCSVYLFSQELHAKGNMFMIGAYANPPDGATFIFRGDSPACCDEWLKRDPYLANKLVTNYRIREWCVVPLDE